MIKIRSSQKYHCRFIVIHKTSVSFVIVLYLLLSCLQPVSKVYAAQSSQAVQSSQASQTSQVQEDKLPDTQSQTAQTQLESRATETQTESSTEEKVLQKDKAGKKDTVITISAAGDCTFGSDRSSPASVNFYSVYKKKKNPAYFFKKVKPIFEKDDMTLVNFEGTLTKSTAREPKQFAFKGSPSYVNILKKGSVEAVAFANNHCRDFGKSSYADTIQTFQKAKITYSSYTKVAVYKVKEKKIGMIAVNGLENINSVKQWIREGMKKLKKKKADIYIVSMHAGIEHTYKHSATQKAIARYAVEKGANLVLGHHPHVLQGIEKYKGAYIVYSLGNFCFGGNTNPSDKDTMIFQQKFVFHKRKLSKSRSTAQVIPCFLSSEKGRNNYQPIPAKGKKKGKLLKKIDSLCRPLGLTLKNKKGKYGNTLR